MTAIELASAHQDYEQTSLERALRDIARAIERDARTALLNSSGSETVDAIVGSLKQRVARSPKPEDIQAIIGDLQTVRKIVQMQGTLVQHAIAEYERLNLAATEATRIITGGLGIADETAPTEDGLEIEGIETAASTRLPLPAWGQRYEAIVKEETN